VDEELEREARDVHARTQTEGAEQVGAGALGTDADAFEAQALALLAIEFPMTSSSLKRSWWGKPIEAGGTRSTCSPRAMPPLTWPMLACK